MDSAQKTRIIAGVIFLHLCPYTIILVSIAPPRLTSVTNNVDKKVSDSQPVQRQLLSGHILVNLNLNE
jgi:hypothetical protein